MSTRDAQQQRLLERLRQADGEPVSFGELRVDGIAFPAAIVSELELSGYAIDRVHRHGQLVGVRLREPATPEKAEERAPRRLGWRHR